MFYCKTTPTPVITGLKLNKDDDGSTVDLTLYKRLVGSLMYLTTKRPDIMYGVSMISRWHGVTEILQIGKQIKEF